MSNEIKNAEQPAFPIIETNGNGETSVAVGLTKREYFAGLAMQGIWASVKDDAFENYVNVARMAINQADELLKQLNQ